MHGPLRRRRLPLTRSACAVAAGLLVAAPGAARDAPRAPGGEPLLAATETAVATVVGTTVEVEQIDLHGWVARLRVESVLAGELAPGAAQHIAWEELAQGRPARFRDGERILVALEPLPGASLWRKRFPARDVLVVAARGDAFLRAPDRASVESLAAFLALDPEERDREAGTTALAGLVSRADPPLARAAIRRLGQVPGLDARLAGDAADLLAGTLADPERPVELRRSILVLIEARRLRSLRPLVEAHAAVSGPLQPEALAALAALDGELPADRVAALIDSEDPRLRAVAVRHAVGTPAEGRLPGLVLRDPAPEVRGAAVEALLAARGAGAIDLVSPGLFDAAPEVREAAVRGLAALGEAAVPSLEHLATTRQPEEARAPLAALALAGRPGREALARIAASHENERIRAIARLFLGREPRRRH